MKLDRQDFEDSLRPTERPRPLAGLLEELLRQIPAELDAPLPEPRSAPAIRPWSFRAPWLVAAGVVLAAALAYTLTQAWSDRRTMAAIAELVAPKTGKSSTTETLSRRQAESLTIPSPPPVPVAQSPAPPATRAARPAEPRRQNAATEREVAGGVAGGLPGGIANGSLAAPPAETLPEREDALEKAKSDLLAEGRIAVLADKRNAASDRDDATAPADVAVAPPATLAAAVSPEPKAERDRLFVEPAEQRNADGTVTIGKRWRLESPAIEGNSLIAQEEKAHEPAAAAPLAETAAAPFAAGSWLKVHLLPEAPEIRAALEDGRWPDTRHWRRPEQAKKERQTPVLIHPLRVLALDLLAFLRQEAKSPQKAEELLAQAQRLAAAEPQDPAAAELRDLIEEAAALARAQAGQS